MQHLGLFISPHSISSGVSSEVRYVTMLCFHHRPCSSQDSQRAKQYCTVGLTESAKHAEDNKAHRKCKSEGNSYSLKRGKWQAATLANTLRMVKIRSNLQTSEYAGSIPSDYRQVQALVEPRSFPGVT